jgi:hypothetical protein
MSRRGSAGRQPRASATSSAPNAPIDAADQAKMTPTFDINPMSGDALKVDAGSFVKYAKE